MADTEAAWRIATSKAAFMAKLASGGCRHCGGSGWLGTYEQCSWCDGTGRAIQKEAHEHR